MNIKLESHLILKRCPHCRVADPNISLKTSLITNSYDNKIVRHWGIYVCARCGGIISASSSSAKGWVSEMFPESIYIDESLPEKAKAFLDQAVESLHAPSGAIMLAASAIDSMLKEKGYIKGKLYTRIKTAAKDHLITNSMAEWAHEVRLAANGERHADEDFELPTEQDAKKTVDFALALAEFLFVLPSKVEQGIQNASSENA